MTCGVLAISFFQTSFAQRRAAAKPQSKPIVFAVLDDGKTLEPIGVIDKGELAATTGGDAEAKQITAFVAGYYKPKTTYNLIFGSGVAGTVAVKSSNPKSDCAKNQAEAATQSTKAKLKGFVMALATSDKTTKRAAGVRRLPTAAERAEIETLVRAEFVKQGASANAAKNLKYYNLTALDVDDDKKPEMVGSFWLESSAKERNLLFFIADADASGKYDFGYSEYQKVTPDDVMSGELKDLDEMGGELLLDALDYDGDKSAEIFTITQAFEGNNFHVYSRRSEKWTRVFEGYNYHCAF